MKLFFSAPISSLQSKEEKVLLKTTINHIIEDLKKNNPSVSIYYSPHNSFKDEYETIATDIHNIESCDIFILIYPVNTGTSALFETGIAYAHDKKLIFCKHDDVDLPFMLKHLPEKTLLAYSNPIDLQEKLFHYLHIHKISPGK